MHPTSILLSLASAALIRAVAIPQPAPDNTYNTCIDQYAQMFESEIDPEAPASIAQCTSCAAQAVGAAFVEYVSSGLDAAKHKYDEQMAECVGQTDEAEYNTCLNEFGTILEFAPSPSIATCTGCAGTAFAQAFVVYGTSGIDAAKQEYNVKMQECRE